jgi:flagellar hook protein FlgE
MSSLSISETGLDAVDAALGAVSDNLANAQTIGFKDESVEFETLLGEMVGENDLGGGVTTVGVNRDFSEGALVQSNSPLDMALQGNGFFVFQGADGQLVYSRNGQITEAADGTLVGSDGSALMGFTLDAAGNPGGTLGTLQIPAGLNPPAASTKASVSGNLDAGASTIAVGTTINPSDPATYSSSASAQVYDSLGNSHVVTFYYQNNGAGSWTWLATVDGSTAGVAGNTGTVVFNAQGQITSGAAAGPLAFTPAGATAESIALNFSGLTQFASQTALSGSADGCTAGTALGVQVDDNGIVSVTYSNGQTVAVGQVVVAEFPSAQGLELTNGGVFTETTASGVPVIGTPGANGSELIRPSTLEQSNVNTASELVNLVTLERAYEANAKALETANNTESYLEQLPIQ